MQVEVRLLTQHHACECGIGAGVAPRALGVGGEFGYDVTGRGSGGEDDMNRQNWYVWQVAPSSL